MHYASLVALMNFLCNSNHPEIYFLVPLIFDKSKTASIEYDTKTETWIVKQYNGLNTDFFKSALDVVGFLFKENYSLSELRREVEESAYLEALFYVKRYKSLRDILGKDKLESELMELEREIQKVSPIYPPKLELIKNED